MSAKSKPVHQVRIGRIRASIWANPLKDGAVMHNVTVQRLYKDGESWKSSSSFGRHDLPLVMKVVDRCHSWIFDRKPRPAVPV
jgi:hypothetical protein